MTQAFQGITSLFTGPPKTSFPDPPAPILPPSQSSTAAADRERAAEEERRRLAVGGRSSTIATSPLGVVDPVASLGAGKKTYLG